MKKVILLTGLLVTMAACGTTMHAGDGFSMYGSPEGIRAYNEGIIGAINEGKTPSGMKSAHYEMVQQRNVLKFGLGRSMKQQPQQQQGGAQ